MLCVVPRPQWVQRLLVVGAVMQRPQHARQELVDTITLLYQRDQRRNPALIVHARPEMRKDKLLKKIDLVLKVHHLGDGLVPLIGVVDRLERNVLLILECAIELGVLAMEAQLGEKKVDVFAYQRTIA